jgi:hypothetical protein
METKRSNKTNQKNKKFLCEYRLPTYIIPFKFHFSIFDKSLESQNKIRILILRRLQLTLTP